MHSHWFKTQLTDPSKIRAVLASMVFILITSCSNSKLVLGPLYNRLDDQMRKEFNKLGRFNDEQKAEFELRLQTFHLWHRRLELPRYAALIKDVEVAISTPRTKTADEVKQWLATIEEFSVEARRCHPVNFSFELMKTATDEQVDYIERRFAREQGINRKKYDARSPEERIERRYDFVIKWTGRVGLDFTDEQKTLLKASLNEQISLRKEYWALSSAWNHAFFRIARDQQAATYDERMARQLDNLWTLLESNHQEQWQANRDMWAKFFLDFVNSMTTDQREWADAWLGKLANTFRDMSDDSVRFESREDTKRLAGSSLGCSSLN